MYFYTPLAEVCAFCGEETDILYSKIKKLMLAQEVSQLKEIIQSEAVILNHIYNDLYEVYRYRPAR